MKRRDFIKNMAATAGSISPLLKYSGSLALLSSTAMASAPFFSDYKAIVVLNLDGGSDSMTTFPPTGEETYAQYKEIREDIAVENKDLRKSQYYQTDDNGHYVVEYGDGNGHKQPYWPEENASGDVINQFKIGSYHTRKNAEPEGEFTGMGIHAFMPELAALYDNKKLSIVSNVGPLVEPIFKDGVKQRGVKYPQFLYSHKHQTKAVDSMDWDVAGSTGWAGRLADRWMLDDAAGLNLSFTGGGGLFNGLSTSGLGLTRSGLKSFRVGNSYLVRLSDAIENGTITEENNFRRVYAQHLKNQARFIDNFNSKWSSEAPNFNNYTAKNAYGKKLFDVGADTVKFREDYGLRNHHGLSGDLLDSFRDTAKMINLSKKTFGSKRQIYYINDTGYDYHSAQSGVQTKHLRTMSMAVSDFYKAIEEMGMDKEVLVVMTSEFGRTLKSNINGTDHGWGGHSFMLCGDPAFNGGNVFGSVMDDLSAEGRYTTTRRSRIIPSTSMEQMMAPALKWFGVDEETMTHVLPNLHKFKPDSDSDDIETAFLQDVFA